MADDGQGDPEGERVPYDRAEWETRLAEARARRAEVLARREADGGTPGRKDARTQFLQARAAQRQGDGAAAAPQAPPRLHLGPDAKRPPRRPRPVRWPWAAGLVLACFAGGAVLALSQEPALRALLGAAVEAAREATGLGADDAALSAPPTLAATSLATPLAGPPATRSAAPPADRPPPTVRIVYPPTTLRAAPAGRLPARGTAATAPPRPSVPRLPPAADRTAAPTLARLDAVAPPATPSAPGAGPEETASALLPEAPGRPGGSAAPAPPAGAEGGEAPDVPRQTTAARRPDAAPAAPGRAGPELRPEVGRALAPFAGAPAVAPSGSDRPAQAPGGPAPGPGLAGADRAALPPPDVPADATGPARAQTATGLTQVLVHYPPLAEGRAAEAMATLDAAGIPAEGVPVDFAVSRTNVRYYYAADSDAAGEIAGIVAGGLDIAAPQVRDFTEFRPQPVVGLVELWLRGDTAAPAASTADAGS